MNYFYALALLALLQPAFSQTPYGFRQILPAATDPAINGSSDPHDVYLDSQTPPLNKLLVFFPGTTASGDDYGLFLQTAAGMGYHVIGLDYENEASINLSVCQATRDTTCHRRARYEVWFGEDTHDALAVSPPNSVIHRLTRLLQYLHAAYPLERWDQFLLSDGAINWKKITTAGHSQGAGHAAFASKRFEVERTIMISWTDWMYPGRTADWITAPGPTPDNAYYGFIHTGDAAIYNGIPTTWNQLGMAAYGPILSVDTSASPYHQTHSLVSSRVIDSLPTMPNFHNATCVDWMTPINPATGLPVFLPVWQYLLQPAQPALGQNAQKISPNGASYIDPELLSSAHKIAFQTGAGAVWLADLDSLTGLFRTPGGLDLLIDTGATPLIQSFNGPEFGIDATGWSVFYTKPNGLTPQVWRAQISGHTVSASGLTTGATARLSNQPTKSPSSPSIRLLYSKGSSLSTGLIGWIDELQPQNETLLDSLDRGVRWIDGRRAFSYVKQTGPWAGQIALYDSETQTEEIITNDSYAKTYSLGWFAPEYQDLLVMAILNDTTIGIYKDQGRTYWELISLLEMPSAAAYNYVGSPEPFVAGNKSYISLTLRSSSSASSYVPAEVWVLGIDPNPNRRLMLRCDDGAPGARRTDPESYIGSEEVFIYYNLLNAKGEFEIWRYATGIPTATVAKTKEMDAPTPLFLYPNPTHGTVFMDLPEEEIGAVTVFDVWGRKVGERVNARDIDLSFLPGGTYVVQVEAAGKKFVGNVVRIK